MTLTLTASVGLQTTGDSLMVTVQLTQPGGYAYANMQYFNFSVDSVILGISNEKIMSEVRRRGLLNLMKDYKSATE